MRKLSADMNDATKPDPEAQEVPGLVETLERLNGLLVDLTCALKALGDSSRQTSYALAPVAVCDRTRNDLGGSLACHLSPGHDDGDWHEDPEYGRWLFHG